MLTGDIRNLSCCRFVESEIRVFHKTSAFRKRRMRTIELVFDIGTAVGFQRFRLHGRARNLCQADGRVS